MPAGEIHENDVGTYFKFTFKTEGGTIVSVAGAGTIQGRFKRIKDKEGDDVTDTVALKSLTAITGNSAAKYVSVAGDLTPSGWWQNQGYIATGSGGNWYTDIHDFRVYPNL